MRSLYNLDRIRTLLYFSWAMDISQQVNKAKFSRKASWRQRAAAGVFFVAIAGVWLLLYLAGNGKIDLGILMGPCGFKQQYNLPCPTCGMTHSAIAFAEGKIFESFYIQPSGALFCSVLTICAFLALLTGVFGVYFTYIDRFFREVGIGYIIAALLIITAAGWAVTLARAIAAKN
jgi:hypothetical protein